MMLRQQSGYAARLRLSFADCELRLPRHFWISALVVMLVCSIATGLYVAAHRPFWFDELCTVAVVRQQGVSRQWQALADAVDGNPPLFHLAEAAVGKLVGTPEIAYRILPLLGCVVMQFGLFAFVRRQAGDLAGLIAALIPPLTAANYYYTEARPYGIVLGVITVALLCWRRGDKWGMAGLALSLALAVSFHYYGIFAALCIGAAEIVRSILLRKLRLAVWLALAAGSACLAIYWPLLQAFKRYYGAHFWAKPKLLAVFTAYGHILDLPQSLAVPFAH